MWLSDAGTALATCKHPFFSESGQQTCSGTCRRWEQWLAAELHQGSDDGALVVEAAQLIRAQRWRQPLPRQPARRPARQRFLFRVHLRRAPGETKAVMHCMCT